MIKIRPDQHARILGFAILGYGFQALWTVLDDLNLIRRGVLDPYSEIPLDHLLLGVISENFKIYLFLIVSVVAGVSLLAVRSRSKLPAILFVLGVVSFFPLGTILSFYVLFYLFVINEQDAESTGK